MTRDIHSIIYQGVAAENRGNHQAALRLFQEALSLEPDSALAHARLSLCLSSMNRRYGALAEAEQALRFGPEEVLSHVAYGLACLHERDDEGLNRSVARIRELNPLSIDGLWLECLMALRERRPKDLRKAAEALLRASPNFPEAKFFLSRAESMEGRGLQAEVLAREALASDPLSANAHEAIGWAFYIQGNMPKARAAALSVLSLAPTREGAHILLGAVELRKSVLTGWFYRVGLWISRQNTTRLITIVVAILFCLDSTRELARFLQIPLLIQAQHVVAISIFVILVLSPWAVSRKLNKELRQVKLTLDY